MRRGQRALKLKAVTHVRQTSFSFRLPASLACIAMPYVGVHRLPYQANNIAETGVLASSSLRHDRNVYVHYYE